MGHRSSRVSYGPDMPTSEFVGMARRFREAFISGVLREDLEFRFDSYFRELDRMMSPEDRKTRHVNNYELIRSSDHWIAVGEVHPSAYRNPCNVKNVGKQFKSGKNSGMSGKRCASSDGQQV